MSTTKNTAKNTAAIKAAEQAITEAEAKHAALLAESTAAEENVTKAQAELHRIEQCIANDDPKAGLEELTKTDTELRFHKLQAKAKARAARFAGGAVATARTALILARLEAGEYGIAADKLTAEAEALASKIAGLLQDYAAKCDAHNAGRLRLLADAKESDAVNDQGTGNPASSLAHGHEERNHRKPFWIEVDGELVASDIGTEYRLGRVQERAKLIVEHHEKLAANVIQFF
ncbi:hypothetical protein [Arthrobacter sp. ISL-72]|uniref:hypothetical protein n=1 Tax=Arthrobacter sp. ISL-72 TaxID=2819114 RepID=UPI001BEB5723|nr:hypothetical protein [Arthrobacter sp. ISL-72]MBT2594560.1 hypothetical protein [Arthrobacter sp. ISL-72]